MPTPKSKPVYLFDTCGVAEVFSTGSNAAIAKFIDGLKSGSVKIMDSVVRELELIDAQAAKSLADLRIRSKTIPASSEHFAMHQLLMDQHGAGIFGALPTAGHFESVAVARVEKLVLVSASTGLKECKKIVASCKLDPDMVFSVADFASVP